MRRETLGRKCSLLVLALKSSYVICRPLLKPLQKSYGKWFRLQSHRPAFVVGSGVFSTDYVSHSVHNISRKISHIKAPWKDTIILCLDIIYLTVGECQPNNSIDDQAKIMTCLCQDRKNIILRARQQQLHHHH